MRIVSLVPSLTELLSHLGLDDELVGITKFCIHPNHIYRNKTRIGGTKTVDLERVAELTPDLIIANREENVKEQVEALATKHEVLLTDIHDLDSALAAILEIGHRTGKGEKAQALCQEIQYRFSQLKPVAESKVLYLIWKDPYMSAGHDTFIHDMLSRCGFESVCAHLDRYPEVPAGAFEPDLILLSSEPFPFSEKHMSEMQSAWPEAKIKLVEGEYFSWYGSRLLGAVGYFEELNSSLV